MNITKATFSNSMFVFHYFPMLDADYIALDPPAAPIVAAAFAFHYHPMLDADSALLDTSVTPVVAAASVFHYCPMLVRTPPCCATCLPHPSWLQHLRLFALLSLSFHYHVFLLTLMPHAQDPPCMMTKVCMPNR